MYKSGQVAYPDVLRKINFQGTDKGMLYTPPGIRFWDATSRTSYLQREGVEIYAYELHNAAADSVDVGIGFRLSPYRYQIGRLSADGATYTDLTASNQARSALTLQVAGADQTGFVILTRQPISWVSTTITTAETNAGGSTVVDHTVQYSNIDGTDWNTVTTATDTNTDDFTKSNGVWAAALTQFVWKPPSGAWGKTNGLGGLPNGWYALRFTSAQREASDVAAIATGLEVGTLRIYEDIEQYGVVADSDIRWKELDADGVVAYFSTASNRNAVSLTCQSGS